MSTTKTHTPLSAAELLEHPGYATNDWSKRIPPTSSGYAQINNTSRRAGGPFKLHYEIHGTGPVRIVWIMGLGAFRTAWKRQSEYFGHKHGQQYSCIVFDNRGVGKSDKPLARYSTTEMAIDTIELLAEVGWLDKAYASAVLDGTTKPSVPRTLNVAGVSMGGMIAQEFGLLVPDCIQSLFLVSTAPRLVRTVPFVENLRQRINMFVPRSIDVQLEEVSHRLFSEEFLAQPDTENEDSKLNFATNRDRFASSELAKRKDTEGFTRKGFILQAIAAGWHSKDREQLQKLLDLVGGNRIIVMHGTGDQMLTYKHFEILKDDLGEDRGVTYLTWKGAGHVLAWEVEDDFNRAIEENVSRTAALE